jgi:hypothetical protein
LGSSNIIDRKPFAALLTKKPPGTFAFGAQQAASAAKRKAF